MGKVRLTKQIVVDYHAHMAKKFDFEIINKKDSCEMKAVGNALELMRVMDAEQFMKRYATTIPLIPLGETYVYIPWTPGHSQTQSGLFSQIRKLAHEAAHAIQFRDLLCATKYLTSRSHRARDEAEAMHVDCELYYWFNGRPYNTQTLADRLKKYAVRKSDRAVTKKHLDIYNRIIKRGFIGSAPAKEAIRFLKRAT